MSAVALAPDRPRRWSVAFSEDMSDAAVQRLLGIAPFRHMNAASFPRSAPLADILRNDAGIRRYKKGEIIVREGDYGTSAFMVVSGAVQAVLSPGLPPAIVGRREPSRRGWFSTLAQWWGNSREDEVLRSKPGFGVAGGKSRSGGAEGAGIVLQDIPRVLGNHRTAALVAGDFFGEIAALSRMPRTATVFADEDGTELLEIRWQGLRDLMRHDPQLRRHIDGIYRERALATYLSEIPFIRRLPEEAKQRVMAATQFETYGDYDWSGEYKKLIQSGAMAAKEQTIAAEGDYPNGVIMIRAGFARLTQRHGHGHRTISYLGSGRVYGFDEVAHNWRHPLDPIPLQHTLRVIGYTHVLVIPTVTLEQVVLPALGPEDFPPSRVGRQEARSAPVAPISAPGTHVGPGRVLRGKVPDARGEPVAGRSPGRFRTDGISYRESVFQRYGGHVDRYGSLHALRRLRARLRLHARQQPKVPPARSRPREHHGGAGLHALRRPHLHDRLPDGRDPPRRFRGRSGRQSIHLHRLHRLRQQLPVWGHPHG